MNQRGIWQLILMAREGDRHAIDELFYFSFRPAYLILYAITGDQQTSLDILAEGYTHIFQNLDDLESGSDFNETLNRFTIDRVCALFPSDDFLKLHDDNPGLADAFRQSPPQLHDFDTLPTMNLSSRADEILATLHAQPTARQICVYLYYFIGIDPDTIADFLHSTPGKVYTALQQVRQSVVPQIEALLKNSTAFRGTDAESALLWALRRTDAYAPSPGETDAFYQSILDKLVAAGLMETADKEEAAEPEPDFPMRDFALPKEHRILHLIFSLHTLIILLSVLAIAGLLVGVWALHRHNQGRQNEPGYERPTFSITTQPTTAGNLIFSTDYAVPTETETQLPQTTEPQTEPVATTEPPSEPETTTEAPRPTATTTTSTTSPYADFKTAQNGNALTITDYTGSRSSLEIPAQIDGKPVTAIGDNAFFNKNFTTVSMPSSIRSIGKKAFGNCVSLQRITIPAAVTTIDAEAFRGCTALRTVSLSSSLTKLGSQAFSGCSALESITLPASLSDMGGSVFSDCTSLRECRIESKSHLRALGNATFMNCYRLETFTVPDSVKAIPASCFAECSSLEIIRMHNQVATIGQSAFFNCKSLTDVTFGNDLTKIEASAFSGCKQLDSVRLPSKTTSIGASAFSGCTHLKDVFIPDSVKQIGADAFNDCSKDLAITCSADSYASQYAEKAKINVIIENESSASDQ